MGQTRTALMLGIKPSAALFNQLDPEDDWIWTGAQGLDESPETSDDGGVLGFCVACAHDTSYGAANLAAYLPATMGDLERGLTGAIERARAKWDQFAMWLNGNHCIRLPQPQIFLVEVERA